MIRFSFPVLPGVEGGVFQVAPTDGDFHSLLQTGFVVHSLSELDIGPPHVGTCRLVVENDLAGVGSRMS